MRHWPPAVAAAIALLLAAAAAQADASCAAPELRTGAGSLSLAWSSAGPSGQLLGDDGRAVPLSAAQRSRVEASNLYSTAAADWWRTRFSVRSMDVVLLSHEPLNGRSSPQAAIVWLRGDPLAQLALWPARPGGEADALERIYALLLMLPADSRVRLLQGCGVLQQPTVSDTTPVSALLRRIASTRVALETGSDDDPAHRWRLVDIKPVLDGNQPLSVAALVSSDARPVPGASVSFTRAPHLACWAVTDAAGLASCHLYDEHGHEHPADPSAAPPATVITFAGRSEEHRTYVPLHAIIETPSPTRCLSEAIAPDLAATWSAGCRGFAPKAWDWPTALPH